MDQATDLLRFASQEGRWAVIACAFVFALRHHAQRVDWPKLAREVPLVVAAYLAYFLVRGSTEGGAARAFANTDRIIDFERALRFYWEPAWQRTIVDHQVLVDLANWIYIWGHWPVVVVTAIWLFIERPGVYYLYRNAFLISGAVGLAVFALYPVAPPRFIEADFVDTVTLHSHAYRVLQPPAFVNQYAAMPSLHFGWNLLIGVAIVRYARSLPLRIVGAVLPVCMFFAVVLTANHFIFDAIAGAALALAALWVAASLRRSNAQPGRAARPPAPAFRAGPPS